METVTLTCELCLNQFHYMIDIANQELKIAIEVDGSAHLLTSRKQIDQEKDKYLISNGWTVFRFTNLEVMTNPKLCAQKVFEYITSRREQETISPTEF